MTRLRVAVVLAGCGHRDGAEIREAVFTLLALDEAEAQVQCFAPDVEQLDVIDHLTGKPMQETRSVLREAARIARGDVKALSEFRVGDFDALVFPGGNGAAKNLSDFAVQGSKAVVRKDVRAAVESMHKAGKPLGFICITPASVGATVLGTTGVALTAGAANDPSASAIAALGATHVPCATTDTISDRQHRVVSTPAYMDGDARTRDVYAGIKKLVDEVVAMCHATVPA